MFDWLTVETIMEQTRPLVVWLLAYQADLKARAWHQLWTGTPWWFQAVLVAYVTMSAIAVARRWIRPFLGTRHWR